MKKLLFIALVALTLFATACTKTNNCCAMPDRLQMVANKNSKAWTAATLESAKIGTDSIAIMGRLPEEWLILKLKFAGKGVYTLKRGQAFNGNTVGGDVMVAEYQLDDSAANSLEITDYNSSTGIIKGKFDLTFNKSSNYPNAAYPSVVKFSQGTFTHYLPK